ncbi:hypothetical protein Dsin_004640 [Dipteronia sinensis]|uniref:Uncharacterized protein n=1 Tax=Dipteronia sinensis TaxID=43782 RepID=A0AAE0AVR8_9ROSI|nr:hypothetical protein Dsin_004640 [Dipteronia sinensis]
MYTHMKIPRIPVSAFLILFLASILVLNNPLTSILNRHIQFLSSSPLLFSLFNTIIFSIIIGSYKPYTNEVGQDLTCLYYSHEVGEETQDYIKGNSDEEEDNYEEYHGSDGYEEDDDDSGSVNEVGWADEEGYDDNLQKRIDEVGWADEEGHDDNLQKRIEDFIAKVTNGWKEENLREKIYPS